MRKELVCGGLVGRFVQRNQTTLEYGIEYDHFPSCTHTARDFCVLEKEDCSTSKTSDASANKCPTSGRGNRCEKFSWSEITFVEKTKKDKGDYSNDQEQKTTSICVAVRANYNISHDRNGCRNHLAARLWFEKDSGEELLRQIAKQLEGNSDYLSNIDQKQDRIILSYLTLYHGIGTNLRFTLQM